MTIAVTLGTSPLPHFLLKNPIHSLQSLVQLSIVTGKDNNKYLLKYFVSYRHYSHVLTLQLDKISIERLYYGMQIIKESVPHG